MHVKPLALFSFFLLCLFVSCSDKAEKQYSAKDLKTDEERRFIFTERKQYFMDLKDARQVQASFKYINDTGDILFIDTIKTNCGCTVADYSRKPIHPKDRGEIIVTVDLPKMNGYFSQVAAVYFRGREPVVLKVMGKNVFTEEASAID